MLVMFIGYLYGRYSDTDLRSISNFSMKVLSPALIFSFLVRNELTSDELFQIVVAVLLFTAILTGIIITLVRLIGMKVFVTPILLATVFPNTGNYGLPVLLFAYGHQAFSIGVVIVVLNFILMYSLGVYFASLQGSSWRIALYNVIRLPTTYATICALVVNLLDISLPNFIYNPLRMMGEAMIPVVLLILGIQLAHSKIRGVIGPTVVASLLRLIASPMVMLGVVYFLGIGGLMAKVLIIQHSMPTAVIMTMISAEYKTYPYLVANATFLSTLFSFFSITVLLYAVNAIF